MTPPLEPIPGWSSLTPAQRFSALGCGIVYNGVLQLKCRTVLVPPPARHERSASVDPQHSTKPCSKCRRVLPLTSFANNKQAKDGKQSWCADCHRAYYVANQDKLRADARARYTANPEPRRAYVADWRRRNPDKTKEYNASGKSTRWFKANRGRALSRNRAYVDRNRERYRLWWREKARRRQMAMGSDPVDYTAIRRRDNGICYLCHNPVPDSRLHFDHVVPLARGGTHTADNIRVTHARCNLRKGAKVLELQ
jgi:5-methylcytosine-specific restriction endonuclease McrA